MKLKRWIAVGAVIGLLAATWGLQSSGEMTSIAAAKAEKQKEPVIVAYDYLEDYESCMMYALEGAELFAAADPDRKVGELDAGEGIYCYQKTDNGYYYGTVDRNRTYYIHEDAVSDVPQSTKKAVQIANEDVATEGILFVCSSFGELESVELYNPSNDMTVILQGMGMYDYETYSFISEGDTTLELTKTYNDGQVIRQTFDISGAAQMVGIYDDGSYDQSWLEIDGVFQYEE